MSLPGCSPVPMGRAGHQLGAPSVALDPPGQQGHSCPLAVNTAWGRTGRGISAQAGLRGRTMQDMRDAEVMELTLCAAASCPVQREPRTSPGPSGVLHLFRALFLHCLPALSQCSPHRFVAGQLCQPCSHPCCRVSIKHPPQPPASAADVLCQRCASLSAKPLHAKQGCF